MALKIKEIMNRTVNGFRSSIPGKNKIKEMINRRISRLWDLAPNR